MQSLISQIINGTAFSQSVYNGEEAIFDYLKGLNDLVRLAGGMKSQFPYEDYKKVDQVPLIEVEFSHLSEFDTGKGQVSILDTPGPNESDQPHLAIMLKEQLSKASAVISVMDYTQLRSTADAEVRQSIDKIPSEIPLYILVNKFDQKDRNGDDAAGIKQLVTEKLMKGRVAESDVYPVSSMQAYLSNRAKRHIDAFGKLPDYQSMPWVEDFGEEAIGRKWKKDIESLSEVKDAASELWKESKFSEPMTNILHTAHANAASFAVKSAVEKIKALTDSFNRELSLLNQGVHIDIQELESSMKALRFDIDNLKEAECSIRIEALTAIDKVMEATTKSASVIQKSVDEQVEKYFKDGRKQELKGKAKKARKKKKAKKQQSGPVSTWGNFITSALKGLNSWESNVGQSKDQDFDPNETVIEFSDRTNAKKLLKKIEKSTSSILADGQLKLESIFSECLDELDLRLNSTVKESIEPIRLHIEAELKKAGFTVELSLPSFDKHSLSFSVDTVFDSALEKKYKTETHQRRQSGAWGTVCSWFNTDDWGWEDYDVEVKYYHVDLTVIRTKTEKQVQAFINAINSTIEATIKTPVTTEVESFFAEFNSIVESVISNLNTSIGNTSLSADKKEALVEELTSLLERNNKIIEHNSELSEELEAEHA